MFWFDWEVLLNPQIAPLQNAVAAAKRSGARAFRNFPTLA
jgi:hypothetical protein